MPSFLCKARLDDEKLKFLFRLKYNTKVMIKTSSRYPLYRSFLHLSCAGKPWQLYVFCRWNKFSLDTHIRLKKFANIEDDYVLICIASSMNKAHGGN